MKSNKKINSELFNRFSGYEHVCAYIITFNKHKAKYIFIYPTLLYIVKHYLHA